jgi:thiol-disulfide isomerase/thioredoxin
MIASNVFGARARAADEPPVKFRYALSPGRELSYHTEAKSTKGEGSVYLVDWKVWVIDHEADGSWRLVLRCDLTTKRGKPGASDEKSRADTLVWRCRMFDDGRLVGATTMGTVRDPYRLFPRLPSGPKDLERGWDSAGPEKQAVVLHHRLTPGTSAAGDILSISTKAEGPEDKVYLSTHSMRVNFDTGRGVATRVETEDASEHLNPGAVTRGLIELVRIEDRGAEWTANFRQEADRYFDALEAYDSGVNRAVRDAARCRQLLADARATLEAARPGITTRVFLDAIEEKLAAHGRSIEDFVSDAQDRIDRLGKAAALWEAKDFGGKVHRLADCRGKVVVMDFWYRNCGWCIHAMPQVRQLADAFRGQPVAVLGMCTDEKEEDARAVINAMGLNYPTIKATGIPEKFGIKVFPTLIVIDQAGKVREIHVGYSERLYDELASLIRGLLAEKPGNDRR